MKKNFTLFLALTFAFFAFAASAAHSQAPPSDALKDELRTANASVVRFYREKKFEEALAAAQKAANLAAQVYGRDAVETARAETNLGYVRLARNEKKAAEDAFEKAVAVYKKNPALGSEDGAAFADVLEALGSLKYEQNAVAAANLFERALEWREKTAGVESVKISAALSRLASINYWQRDYKKAAARLQRLLDVVSKNPNAFGEDAALAYYRAECAFRKAGDEKKFDALKYDYLRSLNFVADAGKPFAPHQVVPSGTVNGKALDLVKPSYPQEARSASAEGEVRVRVLIDQKGEVLQACSEKGDKPMHPALLEASETAALRSKFSPTIKDGAAVRVTGVIVYRFSRR